MLNVWELNNCTDAFVQQTDNTSKQVNVEAWLHNAVVLYQTSVRIQFVLWVQ